MAPKEGPRRPPKRTAPIEAPKSGYAGERREWRDARSEMERERKIEIRKPKALRSRGPREISIIFHSIPSNSNNRTKGSCQGKIRRKHRITLGVSEI